jgi:transposase
MAGETGEVSTKVQVDTKRQPGSSQRRRWSEALKRQIVAETLEPGSSVSVIARRHDVNTNQVFTWRRQLLAKSSPAGGEGKLVPVEIAPERGRERRSGARPSSGVVEIQFSSGARVSIRGKVALETLRQVVDLLR